MDNLLKRQFLEVNRLKNLRPENFQTSPSNAPQQYTL